jgi:hypothetical protein
MEKNYSLLIFATLKNTEKKIKNDGRQIKNF